MRKTHGVAKEPLGRAFDYAKQQNLVLFEELRQHIARALKNYLASRAAAL